MSCDGKQGFDTFELARRVNVRRAQAGRKGNVYHCACGKYHIGSVFSTRRRRERMEARKRREITA